MRVSVFQSCCNPGDFQGNVENLIFLCRDSDLVFTTPRAFISNFFDTSDRLAISMDDAAKVVAKATASLSVTVLMFDCFLPDCSVLSKHQSVLEEIYVISSGVVDVVHANKDIPYNMIRCCGMQILVLEHYGHIGEALDFSNESFDLIVVIDAIPVFGCCERQDDFDNSVLKLYNDVHFCNTLLILRTIGILNGFMFQGGSRVINEKFVHTMALYDSDHYAFDCGFSASSSAKNDISAESLRDYTNPELLYNSIVFACRRYCEIYGFSSAVLGMSGGVDSALSAAIFSDTLGPSSVHSMILPSNHTSEESLLCAKACSGALGISHELFSIQEIFDVYLSSLHACLNFSVQDIAYGNLQSRIRANILMAISNVQGCLLVATGNKSEALTGYMTIYGDMCGGFAPLKNIYKTDVYALVAWRNANVPFLSKNKLINVIPDEIVRREPSAELFDGQKDTDTLPEYDVLDPLLKLLFDADVLVSDSRLAGFDVSIVNMISGMIKKSAFKRRQTPIGPRFVFED